MKSLRIVFFGTPEFAKNSLAAIHQSHHQIVGVVTATDKASGRGQMKTSSPVKIFAEDNNLPLFQPKNLKEEAYLKKMQSLNADVYVVVAFRMMPALLFNLPKLGTFNLHASLLPDYRGAAPINFAIINGELETGATTFFINEKIDEGNILLQSKTKINPDENAGELHDRLMILGANLVLETLDGLATNSLKEIPQKEKENKKLAYKIFKEDTKINWNQCSKKVHDFIRGLSPYPSAFTEISINGEVKTLKILAGNHTQTEHNQQPGTLQISKKNLQIFCKNGIYNPSEIQLQGKRAMNITDFLNGFQNFENIYLH